MAKRIPCEVYSRIVGYMRPIQQWNAGKRQEYRDRVAYTWRDGQKAQSALDKEERTRYNENDE